MSEEQKPEPSVITKTLMAYDSAAHQEHWQVPNVRQHFDRAVQEMTQAASYSLEDIVGFASREYPCGSPIEAIFFIWWEAMKKVKMLSEEFHTCNLQLYPQGSVTVPTDSTGGKKTYFLDYAIRPYDTDAWLDAHNEGFRFEMMGVELDGHEFHERTKEQVKSRNERDRDLLKAGWKIFHYSGSEIVNRPQQCVREVLEFGSKQLCEMYRFIHAGAQRRDVELRQGHHFITAPSHAG